MTDIHLAEARIQSVNMRDTTSSRVAYDLYHFIFYKYKIDSASFRKNWEFYAAHPELYSHMQEKVVEKLNRMH